MNWANNVARSAREPSHSTQEWTLKFRLAGTPLPSSSSDPPKKSVSYFKNEFIPFLVDPNSVLVKHRKYLKGLEVRKTVDQEERMMTLAEKENKTRVFKENAAKQRTKIRSLKEVELENAPE